ncbi:MAG: hypothetical protein HYW79_01165 [Parcubacteria group bacterium]|nr:hypothetical protein [Parcubacteria group bacterium]
MAKKDSLQLSAKLKAIEVIVKELQKLDESDRPDVISFALKQVGLTPPTNLNSPQSDSSIAGGSQSAGLDTSMADFVKNKNPKNEYQRVAVIAYYREYKQNRKEFKNAEMSQANTQEARQPKISNITDVVTKARDRYKFLTKGTGKATHQLSTHGADIVNALPDQESVKKLIAGAKSRKPRKKKKEKK